LPEQSSFLLNVEAPMYLVAQFLSISPDLIGLATHTPRA